MSLRVIRVHHRVKGKKKVARGGSDKNVEEEEEPEEEEEGGEEMEEWVAEADPGVFITLVPLPDGGNTIRKIRFSKGTYDAWEAQKWWSLNYEKIMDLYSVRRVPSTPTSSESLDESYTSSTQGSFTQTCELDASPQASAQDVSSNASAEEDPSPKTVQSRVVEVIVEDEPGVFITIGFFPNGTKELKRVEFSPERFGEVKARVWWEENKARLEKQYFSAQHCNTLAQKDPTPKTRSGLQSRVIEVTMEDEPGVLITIRSFSNGTKKIMRVELSRKMFREVKARVWWEENKDRLQNQYSQALPCSCSELLF